jgi:hypothetical protein
MTDDPRVADRVRRQALNGAVVLGLVWAAAAASEPVGPVPQWLLLVGWPLMVTVLLLSLREPRLRYLVVVPATLIAGALLAISFNNGIGQPEAAGWWLLTAGIVLGIVLGAWFWFRWLPVPAALDDPFSPGRWALIAVHAALVLVGLVVVAGSLLF